MMDNDQRYAIYSMKKISLYIHFPFCSKKCLYCDFASEDYNLQRQDKWAEALLKEIDLHQRNGIDFRGIKSIYIGGGSPNLISIQNFVKITEKLLECTPFQKPAEFTVEINPVSRDEELIDSFIRNGVNRISVGCQSFHDDELKTLGRIHSSGDIFHTVARLKKAGFRNISLDFIYGIPGQTLDSWRSTLNQALEMEVEHLSLYNLIYEEGTPLYSLRKNNQIKPLDEKIELDMYLVAHEVLQDAGYIHYEISNWAKPGKQAGHNSRYWTGEHYLGLGPSAHSYSGKWRWWNYRDIDKYIELLINGKSLPIEQRELLSGKDQETEFLFLGLRTGNGIYIPRFEEITGVDFESLQSRIIEHFGDRFWNEFAFVEDKCVKLTPRGWFIGDYIVEKMMQFIEEIRK